MRMRQMAAWCSVPLPPEGHETGKWFLEHPEFSYEWFLTGRGGMFRKQASRCAGMSPAERLELILELLDWNEARLWHGLGWDMTEVSLAILREQGMTGTQCRAIAGHLGLREAWLRFGQAPALRLL